MALRKVRCVSPHGGAHHGIDGKGRPAVPGYRGPLQLPPADGGYVENDVLGRVMVGAEVDAPEPPAFIADGFHFTDAVTGLADVCTAAGDSCWCGQHRAAQPAPPPGVPGPGTPPPASSPLAGLLNKKEGAE
jgi:hypothetical protein